MSEAARDYRWIGKRPIRPDGVDKVTGRATFGADCNLPDMLFGAVVRSPHAHARIVSIDTSRSPIDTGHDEPQRPSSMLPTTTSVDPSRRRCASNPSPYGGPRNDRNTDRLSSPPDRPVPNIEGHDGSWGRVNVRRWTSKLANPLAALPRALFTFPFDRPAISKSLMDTSLSLGSEHRLPI